jgi:benzoyl-CoA reductase/2-hydroxyglutaryl-CoA dehydratase subunit BcrC/BadD/HgdB
MMLGYFEELCTSLRSKLAATPAGEPVARKRLALEIARLGTRLFSGEGTVAWCGVLVPFDLLHAMGVTSCFVELVGAVLAAAHATAPLLEEAERNGFSTDGCSYHRTVMGAALQGLMPVPDFFVASTAPCAGGLAVMESLAARFRRDLFVIDIPQDRGERGQRYLASQLGSLARFVAAHTGRALDPERLRASVERTNRARELLVEVNALCKRVPFPARRRDLVNLGIVLSLLLGTEDAVSIAGAYRDELAARVGRGEGGAALERARLMWLQNRIQFRSPLEEMLEAEHGAVVVVDELNEVTWDPVGPDEPLLGLARRTLQIPLLGALDWRVANLRRFARDYAVDGAVNPCHWGCRQGTGARGLVERGLREVGVPVLNLEVDCVDSRNFAPGQLRTRVQAFLEMILARKAAAAGAAG